ncbi:MAG TPA: TolC family protein [Bryobacteraceae bacterium]|nr:TolC family protein [Bryobacteraceae bacterium]
MSLRIGAARVRAGGVRLPAIAAVLYCSPMLFAQAGALGSQAILPDYTHGPGWFPGVIKPYRQAPMAPLVIENSPRLHDLIHNGKLELSLADALSLALENNLDIGVQRYLHPVAETDVLRTLSGQAARGIAGALLPSGLSQGALGVGVNQFQGAGGVGSAGGISGGGGAVQVPQAGSFDPSVSFNSSWDRTVAPLNTVQVAGVPHVTTLSTAFSGSYTQMLPDGTSFLFSLNGIRQASTQQFLLYNPAVISRFAFGFNQPLLNGFGLLPNKRFMIVARNDLKTSDELFRLQVTTTVVQVEDAYWNLAASGEAVTAAQRGLEAARVLLQDTERMVTIGNAAVLDVTSARSAVAAAERDLIVARTNGQLQAAQLKSILSKKIDAELDAAEIVTTDQLPEPSDADMPDLPAALETSVRARPDLHVSEQGLQNQNVTVSFTRNGLLPAVNTFGLYASSGLAGNGALENAGVGTSLNQDLVAAYPEFASGLSMTVPLRNRSAQADNLRARLEERQLQVSLQQLRQQIGLEVRQAVIGLVQGKAQVEAAHEAVALADQTADAERKKLLAGISTPYTVVLRERDAVVARQADIGAVAAYARALVEMDRSTGTILERNGINTEDALSGEVTRMPSPPFRYPRYQGVGLPQSQGK